MAGEAELLGRAAAKLDRLLAGTTTGRWRMDGPWAHAGDVHTELVTAGDDRAAVVVGPPDVGAGPRSAADLRYIVCVQPAVGRALVRWLQAEAVSARDATETVSPWAVSVARAILGEGKVDGEGEGSG